MNKWTNVVIHHSASDFGNATVMRNWHIQRGWRDIGYHLVINNGRPCAGWKQTFIPMVGQLEMGRFFDDDSWVKESEMGAHALGYNANSLGICMIHGTREFHSLQFMKLFEVCAFLGGYFNIPVANFKGHYEVDKRKPECPGFDMSLFRLALETEQGKKDFIRYLIATRRVNLSFEKVPAKEFSDG